MGQGGAGDLPHQGCGRPDRLAITIALAFAAYSTNLGQYTTIANTATFVDIGQLISTGDSPVLEILALVLAASIVAALTLSRADREDKPQ